LLTDPPRLIQSKRKIQDEDVVPDDLSNTSTEDDVIDLKTNNGNRKDDDSVGNVKEEGNDPGKFKFHYVQYGTKKLKEKGQHHATRVHFVCNCREPKGTCEAKYNVTTFLANSNKHVEFVEDADRIHNHPPPTQPRKRSRMAKEMRDRVVDYAKMGVPPVKIHQKLVIESPSTAPSASQVRRASYIDSINDMPSGTVSHYLFSYYLY
jgi:hypothetical protein